MTAEIYIFGTHHYLQCGTADCSEEQISVFGEYIQQICVSNNIQLIAEEMSSDGLAHYETEETVIHKLAKEINIQHRYIDLNCSDRAKLNIDDTSLAIIAFRLQSGENVSKLKKELDRRLSYTIRECYWVASILALNIWPTLFVCGADHVENVRSLIQSIDQKASVIEFNYMP